MREIIIGSSDISVEIRFLDSSNGAPREDVAYDSSGMTLWYRRNGAAKVAITPATLASLSASHADGGLLHIDDGICRVDVPDAAFVSGADHVVIGASATGMVGIPQTVSLVSAAAQVVINPLASNDSRRTAGVHAVLFVDETNSFSWPAIYNNGDEDDPYDLTSISTKQLTVANADRRVLKTYANADITAGGANNNIPITDLDPLITAAEGKLYWSLRDIATDEVVVLGHGTAEVVYTP